MTELMRAVRHFRQASERADRAREERDALIFDLHEQGESPKLLAQATNLSENQIFKIVRIWKESKAMGLPSPSGEPVKRKGAR